MRALIIDDEISFFQALASVLTRGNTIDYAHSFAAVQRLSFEDIQQYDVIICDNDLTADLDEGITKVIPYLRNKAGFTNPIIMHTGCPASYFDGEFSLDALDVRFVQKERPYTVERLLQELTQCA